MHLAYALVIVALVAVALLWALTWYSVSYPSPSTPDADFSNLISDYQSYPPSLWFRDNELLHDKWLLCETRRVIIFESNGRVVYDNSANSAWQGKCNFPCIESAEGLTRSVEYIRACALTQGIVIRSVKCSGASGAINNICELAKKGDRYRVVHFSEYVPGPCDDMF